MNDPANIPDQHLSRSKEHPKEPGRVETNLQRRWREASAIYPRVSQLGASNKQTTTLSTIRIQSMESFQSNW